MKKFFLSIFGILFLFSPISQSSNISISPIKVIFENQKHIAALHLENQDNTTTTVQLNVYRWEQLDEKDRLSPTEDILVTPARTILKPHQRQLVRLGLQNLKIADQEMAYRLLIRELPQDNTTHEGHQLNLVLQISLPIFIPPKESLTHYELKILKNDKSKMLVSLKNNGNVHFLVNNFQLFDKSVALSKIEKTFFYLLPGQTHTLNIPLIKQYDSDCNSCKIILNNEQ